MLGYGEVLKNIFRILERSWITGSCEWWARWESLQKILNYFLIFPEMIKSLILINVEKILKIEWLKSAWKKLNQISPPETFLKCNRIYECSPRLFGTPRTSTYLNLSLSTIFTAILRPLEQQIRNKNSFLHFNYKIIRKNKQSKANQHSSF